VSSICTVEEALEEIRRGKMVIVVDDEGRENEGDLIMAAEKVQADDINFIARHARGLICAALLGERLDHLRLGMMVQENTARMNTNFTVSVDAVHGTSTGISAFDRAITVRALIDPLTKPEDLARPGHIFPLRAVDGGLLRRAGHTEAAVDLARLAGPEVGFDDALRDLLRVVLEPDVAWHADGLGPDVLDRSGHGDYG